MYKAYIAELSTFSSRVSEEKVSEEETREIWSNPDILMYFINHENKNVGFLMLGINGNKHEESNWFIGEFYIAKKHQGQGIGKTVICDLLQKQRGRYCFYVLKKNIRAKEFWKRVFAGCAYENTTNNYFCELTPADCYFNMYSPSEQREG